MSHSTGKMNSSLLRVTWLVTDGIQFLYLLENPLLFLLDHGGLGGCAQRFECLESHDIHAPLTFHCEKMPRASCVPEGHSQPAPDSL